MSQDPNTAIVLAAVGLGGNVYPSDPEKATAFSEGFLNGFDYAVETAYHNLERWRKPKEQNESRPAAEPETVR